MKQLLLATTEQKELIQKLKVDLDRCEKWLAYMNAQIECGRHKEEFQVEITDTEIRMKFLHDCLEHAEKALQYMRGIANG